MTQSVGVWIDHKEAFIVVCKDAALAEHPVETHPVKHVRFGGHDSAHPANADDQRDHQNMLHFEHYYDQVIEQLQQATAIFILGPGEAKGEFKKRLEKKTLGERVVAVETQDKMSEPQIVARVHEFYHNR